MLDSKILKIIKKSDSRTQHFSNYEHPYFFTHKSTPLAEQEASTIEAMYMAAYVTAPEPMIVPEGCRFIEMAHQERSKADEDVRLALLFNIPLEEAEKI